MNTPDNGAFMVAAYAVASVLLVAYALSLFRRYRSGK
jgi:hypothetical protein